MYGADFLFPEGHNYELKIELSTERSILSKSLADAKRFGVKCETRIEPNKYIVAYFTKLLLQREKLDLGVLDSYIPRDAKEAWGEFPFLCRTNEKEGSWLSQKEV